MKNKKRLIISSISILVIISIYFWFFNENKNKHIKINPAFSSYVSAFTSDIISNESVIRIRLATPVENINFNKEIDLDLFDFSPNIDGKAFWRDNQTIEFKPEERLASGTLFNVKFALNEILEVPENFEDFEFQFQTIEQNFTIDVKNIASYNNNDLSKNKIEGSIKTADKLDNKNLEKIIFAKQNDKNLKITWQHEADGLNHLFSIENVLRTDLQELVTVFWNGKDIDVNSKGEKKINVPALGDFKLLEYDVVQQPEQHILLQFSDPLDKEQNLNGLIEITNTDVQFVIDNNKIKVFTSTRLKDKQLLKINKSVKNCLGKTLKEEKQIWLIFEELKPDIRLLGKGVILPNSEGLIFPFEAVNLNAVDVRIIQIYENNIAQFLQVNRLDGDYQLKRVGRLVKKKTIKLNSETAIDFGKWNTFYLDLAQLIKINEGSIYKIELSFRQKHSLYPCDKEIEINETNNQENWDEDLETSNWDYYSDYYYGYGNYNSNYSWNERENPCHISYYEDYYGNNSRKVSRNILASNLGIIAKSVNRKSINVVVTDLISTKPLSKVKIEIYNYQQQLLASSKTDKNGMVRIDLKNQAYLLIAKHGKQRGYLRLDDGSSLSVSKFDVRGEIIKDGLKGYIYGERGVWRPGDSLFINFVLQDKENNLPKNHPVSFELENPQGQITKRIVKTNALNGFYDFRTNTEQNAITGNWKAIIKVGGTKFTKKIKIETVKPNRLKIKIDFGTKQLSVTNKSLNGDLSVKWLHGAVAKNLRTKVSVILKEFKTEFKKYNDFVFDDPVRKFYSEEQVIFDKKINEKGEAVINADIQINESASGMLKANFLTKAFEESGEFSIDRFSIPYSPYESYVGIRIPKGDKTRGMLLTDKKHKIDIVTVDDKGKAISRKNLEVKVYKVNWRWWWDTSQDNLASYAGSLYNQQIIKKTVSTKNGEGQFNFEIKYPDWGRYLVRITDPVSGHATGKTVYVDWPGWAGRSQKNSPDASTILAFSTDKKKYKVGEKAVINIPSGNIGRALVSIENTNKVINSFWVDIQKGENQCEIEITEEMSPNVYAHVTLLQPHAQTANDLPIRMYGVIPIMVENPETKLLPIIEMPNELAPEKTFKIKVKEEKGKKMTYTLAIVDEGLLDLTRFRTPDLWNSFYAREAYITKTWDMFDWVIGAYGGKIEQMFSVGGDGVLRGKGAKKANRFKPMVKFLGTFELGKNKTNVHKFTMPKYIGSVRTMLIAGQNGAYGNAEKTTPVKTPLMVLGTLPRVISVGEEVKLPVTVFAMDKKVKKAKIKIITDDFLQLDENKQTVKFSEIGDKVVNFNVKVGQKIGISKVKIIAESGNEKAEYEIEIDVRNPNPPVTNVTSTIIQANKNYEIDFDLVGVEGTNQAIVEISNIPPINFGKRLKYLISYPHGCVEQTTSSAFPQLYLADVMEVNEEIKKTTSRNIKQAINRLNSFMLFNGGLGYWQNSTEADDWGTSYAGHFILEAEAKAYVLPIGFKKKWIKYQSNKARNWSPQNVNSNYYNFSQDALAQAYRLYTLALAKSPILSAMNRLKERENLPTQAKYRLAMAYALLGQKEIAEEMINNLSTDIGKNNNYTSSYGSRLRDMAMVLETLSLLKQKEKAITIVEEISKRLSSQNWLSTQTTSYCLLAMSKFVGENKTGKNLKFSYVLNKKNSKEILSQKPVYQVDISNKSKLKSNHLEIKNNGKNLIYAKVILSGTPAIAEETERADNISIDIVYKDMQGKIIDVSQIPQGTDFMAQVNIKKTGLQTLDYRNIALTQIFPSGWEIINTRMTGMGNQYSSSVPTYQDIRDDRVYTYFDLNSNKSFTILLNASYLGKFYLPAVSCEAMYNANIQARTTGKWIEVVKN